MLTKQTNTLNAQQAAHVRQRLVEPGEIQLSEVISALSTALDLTEGQPVGHAARSCLIGMRIAEQIGLSSEQRAPLFYALLLKDLGCSSNAAKMSWLFGADDRIVKRDIKSIDWTKAAQCLKFTLKHVAPDANPLQKALKMAAMARAGEEGARELIKTRCHRGADIARELGFPEETAEAITSLDEHWNGKGHPYGLQGEEIPLLSRILGLAQTVEVFVTTFGQHRADEITVQRRGTWFDPQLVDAWLGIPADDTFWESLTNPDFESQVRNAEPSDHHQYADEDVLDQISLAFAHVVDAKSPWTFKHSEGVATIAVGIAEELGCSAELKRDLRRAGLLHDIGKLGVSNLILDKPGRPTDDEFAQIRRHPDYTEQILSRVDAFGRLSDVAAAHHERLDGRGYHRQIPGQQLALESRILAVADVYEALTAKRPYRDGLPQEKVRQIMRDDLGTGLCPECFAALERWLERTSITTRVEQQLEAIETLHNSL